MDVGLDRSARTSSSIAEDTCGFKTVGEAVTECLDRGSRVREGAGKEYRVRSPTRSERMNRALKELRPAAFKVHMLIWTWRGAPARGTLPYFTIRSLEVFCSLTRPTVRKAFKELTGKGWIIRHEYNKHHKNALYRLVAVRKIPPPVKERGKNIQKQPNPEAHHAQGK